MIRNIGYLLLLLIVASCGATKKKAAHSQERKVSVAASPRISAPREERAEKETRRPKSKAENIINTALTFSGVRYKYGGTTTKGMDCSGLLYISFGEHDINLPRVSYQMAEQGNPIRLKNIVKGDLLFFKTGKASKRINHVGMVVAIDGDDIKFIHSTTSRGVIVSSLHEGYWNYAFVKATRIL
ncbi:C40 family peptidase [Kriegella aquimaris]|uniref:Cell wall-associated hydrolase, NlpC family n=1 Tax=Kriegella aquimaris TaxID=192904 RepID=A0A1G9MFC2_9FLAO|nr:C40 family peptidase [Kriegella aquimaris]SDL72793.1 Cell wall-associated hydrolase, NlpC family [Kriegella aquimaris]